MPPSRLPTTLIIGLSGPSSSGKTTLARLLRGIFNVDNSSNGGISLRLFIIHEDDFYKTDKDIPIITATSVAHGTRPLQDWDSVTSLNLPLLDRTLHHVKSHGRPPDDMSSIEDRNSVGEIGVDEGLIESLRDEIKVWSAGLKGSRSGSESESGNGDGSKGGVDEVTICIMDGFLLFPPPESTLTSLAQSQSQSQSPSTSTSTSTSPPDPSSTIPQSSIPLLLSLHSTLRSVLSTRLFLPSTRDRTITRRARRSGYVTIEGFWTDPPGYVEDVVWPNYARDHGWMFASREDVDLGKVDWGGWGGGEGIEVGPGCGEVSMAEVLRWGVERVRGCVEKGLTGEGRQGVR